MAARIVHRVKLPVFSEQPNRITKRAALPNNARLCFKIFHCIFKDIIPVTFFILLFPGVPGMV